MYKDYVKCNAIIAMYHIDTWRLFTHNLNLWAVDVFGTGGIGYAVGTGARAANLKTTPQVVFMTNDEKQLALQNMSDLLHLRQRSLELVVEPAQPGKYNLAEGIGAARY